MEYHDKVLKCSECGAEFVFTSGEQMFFADKGFKNEPKRCKNCKAKRAEGGGGGHASSMRSETKTNCSQCGKETTVPFRPTQGRPVFCRECLAAPGDGRGVKQQLEQSLGPGNASRGTDRPICPTFFGSFNRNYHVAP